MEQSSGTTAWPLDPITQYMNSPALFTRLLKKRISTKTKCDTVLGKYQSSTSMQGWAVSWLGTPASLQILNKPWHGTPTPSRSIQVHFAKLPPDGSDASVILQMRKKWGMTWYRGSDRSNQSRMSKFHAMKSVRERRAGLTCRCFVWLRSINACPFLLG